MILDDGGDATLLVHLGTQAETDRSVISKPGNEEEVALFTSIAQHLDGTRNSIRASRRTSKA